MGERICPEEAPCCGISTGSLLSVMIHSLLLLEPECGKSSQYFAGNCLDAKWLSYNFALILLKLLHLADLEKEI